MRWAGHVARMGERKCVYRVLVGKPEGKRPLGRPRRGWEDNIKMDLEEMGSGGMYWIDLAQDIFPRQGIHCCSYSVFVVYGASISCIGWLFCSFTLALSEVCVQCPVWLFSVVS